MLFREELFENSEVLSIFRSTLEDGHVVTWKVDREQSADITGHNKIFYNIVPVTQVWHSESLRAKRMGGLKYGTGGRSSHQEIDWGIGEAEKKTSKYLAKGEQNGIWVMKVSKMLTCLVSGSGGLDTSNCLKKLKNLPPQWGLQMQIRGSSIKNEFTENKGIRELGAGWSS